MSTAKRFAKNTILLFISQIIVYGFGFFTTIYSAQYLGTAGFGTLSLALALNGILAVFSDLGLSTLLTREVTRSKSVTNKYLSNVILIKIFLVVLTLILLVVTVNLAKYSQETTYVIYLMFISYIFLAFSGIFGAVFQAYEKMEYQSIGNVLNAIILFGGVLFAIVYQKDIFFFAVLYSLGNITVLIFYIAVYLSKFQEVSFDFDIGFCKLTLMEALPLSLAMIFALIHYRIDTVLLSFINGETAVGIYSAAYNIMTVLTFIPIVFTTAVYPLLSQYYLSSKESLKFIYEFSFKILVLLFLPISAGTILLAPQIIDLIYKSAYYPSIGVLQILMLATPGIFLSYLLGTLLTSINKQSTLFRAVVVSTILNIGLNLILISKFSYLGAAVATVISESLLCILYFHFISKFVSKMKISGLILKPVMATVVVCLFIIYIKINLILVVIISVIIYFAILFALKTFTKKEIHILMDMFNFKSK